jgi:hypothetical protein
VSTPVKKCKKWEKVMQREKYKEQDIVEAICLVREEDFSFSAASSFTNEVKINTALCTILADRLKNPTAIRHWGGATSSARMCSRSLCSALRCALNFSFQ